jgi:type VII secretion-associated serine protease mycosin
MPEVWRLAQGDGVVVAVVDGGVQQSVPELNGSVIPGMDLTGGHTDGRRDLDSESSHGTRMAALIAARPQRPESLIGVAPKALILPIVLGVEGRFFDAAGLRTANAIRWAVGRGAQIVNMSYVTEGGSICPPALQRAIMEALDRGVVLIASAGNGGNDTNQPSIPAVCPGVIAVGAIDNRGVPWIGSQRQSYVDLAAPGVGIVSVDRLGKVRRATGTSDAAALVSGVAALVRARFPGMSGRDVVTRLLATAKDAGAPGKDDQTGYGIVRPLEALTADVPAGAANPVYEELDRLRGEGAPVGGRAAVSARGNWVAMVAAVCGAGVLVGLGALFAVLRRTRRERRRPRRTAHRSGHTATHQDHT